jgi:Rod binding domain-containing protein
MPRIPNDLLLRNGELSAINRLKRAERDKISDKRLKEVSEEFTAVFLKVMLKDFFKEFEKDPLFGNSFEGKFYREMLWGEYVKSIARNGGFGFTKEVYKFLKQRS